MGWGGVILGCSSGWSKWSKKNQKKKKTETETHDQPMTVSWLRVCQLHLRDSHWGPMVMTSLWQESGRMCPIVLLFYLLEYLSWSYSSSFLEYRRRRARRILHIAFTWRKYRWKPSLTLLDLKSLCYAFNLLLKLSCLNYLHAVKFAGICISNIWLQGCASPDEVHSLLGWEWLISSVLINAEPYRIYL